MPLLLFSLIWPVADHSAVGPGSAQQAMDSQLPAGWKTYRHPGVPFEMSYPGDFLLDAHVNAKFGFIFALMKKPDTPWLIDIDFADRAGYSMDPYSQTSLKEFAINVVRLGCDADGPEGSVHCPGVARQKVFRNRNGLEVLDLYLNQVYEHYDPPRTTESVTGPIYAVLLPTGRSGQVVIFKRTDNDQQQFVSTDLLKEIADSVSLAR